MKKCVFCNKEIKSGPPHKKYCSELCRGRQKNKKNRKPPVYEDRACVNCGKLFKVTTTNTLKKYCSNRCRRAHHTENRVLPDNECQVCGAIFKGRQRTCSPECALKLSNKKRFYERTKVCIECGTTFTARHGNAKLCSDACAKRRAERKWRANADPRECEWCGKVYQPNNPRDKSCSKECAYNNRLKAGVRTYQCVICGEYFDSNFHGGLKQLHVCNNPECKATRQTDIGLPYVFGYRKECEEIWGPAKCILCGSSTKIHAHHVSGDTSLKDDVVWLCKEHHNAVHYKFITNKPKTAEDYQAGLSTMWYLLFKGELD